MEKECFCNVGKARQSTWHSAAPTGSSLGRSLFCSNICSSALYYISKINKVKLI